MRHEDEKKKKNELEKIYSNVNPKQEAEAAKEKIERETVSLFQVVHEVSR